MTGIPPTSSRPSDSFIAPLPAFDRELSNLIPKLSCPERFRVINAYRQMNRSWKLRVVDPQMATLRAITAEEEAASALYLTLKRRGYSGATRLLHRSHTHKAALVPYLRAVQHVLVRVMPTPPVFSLALLPDHDPTFVELRIHIGKSADGTDLVACPLPPLNFTSVRELEGKEPELEDFSLGVQALAELNNAKTLLDSVKATAQLRNRLLYASDEGTPELLAGIEPYLQHHYQNVCLIIRLFFLIEPYAARQEFVQQCLTGLLRMLESAKDKGQPAEVS